MFLSKNVYVINGVVLVVSQMQYPQWDKETYQVDFALCCCMQVSALNGIDLWTNRPQKSLGSQVLDLRYTDWVELINLAFKTPNIWSYTWFFYHISSPSDKEPVV